MSIAMKPDELAIPYQLPQVPFMAPDMVLPGVLDQWLEDDRLWVPVTASVSFKPLLLSVSGVERPLTAEDELVTQLARLVTTTV